MGDLSALHSRSSRRKLGVCERKGLGSCAWTKCWNAEKRSALGLLIEGVWKHRSFKTVVFIGIVEIGAGER